MRLTVKDVRCLVREPKSCSKDSGNTVLFFYFPLAKERGLHMSLVYLVTNEINGHMYIGKTNSTLKERKRKHYVDSKRGRQSAFCHALRKYPREVFKWEILEEGLSEEEALEREIYYIAEYNTYLDPQHNNMTPGGEGYALSDEIKQKISVANTGKKRTPEQNAKLSETKKKLGLKWTEEQRRNHIERRTGSKHKPETIEKMKSIEKTDTWKENISKSLTGKPKSEDHKKKLSEAMIEQVTIIAENSEERLIFNNRQEAYNHCIARGLTSTTYKIFVTSIRQGIQSKQVRYGYRWKIEK